MISLTHAPYGFPEGKLQTVIVDPPYNIGFDYKNKNNFDDKMSKSEYKGFILELLEKCYEHTKEDSSFFMINYPEIIMNLNDVFEVSSWNIYQYITWVYPTNQKAKSKFTRASRSILWLCKENPKINIDAVTRPYKNPEDPRVKKHIENGKTGTHLYDWWEINLVKKGSKQHLNYVNQIPYELLKRLILTTTDINDIVYDPMCGSGSTIYAASLLGRIGVGYDISPEAHKIWTEQQAKGRNPFEYLR